ncbi:DNA polymerase IV [Myroides sp. LJL116]
MQRAIVHLDLDSFFVSCERLQNSSLNGIPVIIGAGDRGVVSSCSYEARYFGVRSAMPLKMAMRLCPQAKVIKGDMQLYSNLSHSVTDILTQQAPVVEKASIDEFYMDLTGMDKFFSLNQWTKELTSLVQKQTGLPLSYALSVNKTVCKIATTQAKPQGFIHLEKHQVQPFLNPLSIRQIPSVGPITYDTLARIGIKDIRTLSLMPVEILHQILGKPGIDIWQKANGIDTSIVEPYKEKKSISNEHTFETDTIDIAQIKALFIGMVEKLAFELRDQKWLTSSVSVKIRYSNFDTHTKQSKIPYTSQDHTLTSIVWELFDQLYNRRMRLRLIGIQFSSLVRGTYQMNLFENTPELVNLYQTMDSIKKRFGPNALGRCSGAVLKNKHKTNY